MQISRELAQQIQTKAHVILQRDILVAAPDGRVLAGKAMVGKLVPEALRSIEENIRFNGKVLGQVVEWFPLIYEGQTMGAFGIESDKNKITDEVISLAQGLAEVLLHQTFLLDKIQSKETLQADFIKEFLTATAVNNEAIYRQADILQLNLRAQQAVILIRLGGFESTLHAKVSQLSIEEQRGKLTESIAEVDSYITDQAFKKFPGNIVSYFGDDTFCLIKGIGGDNLTTTNTVKFLNQKGDYLYELLNKKYKDQDLTIGIGQYYPDLGGLRKSFQEAQLALNVGSKVWGTGKVYHIKHVGMFTALTNIGQDRKAELAHQILHPLLKDEQLFKTVRTFLTSGLNLTDAAAQLHIHRNTLIYRLDKTKKLINLDPRHFDDALQIKLGLMFYHPTEPVAA